ncbi:MAG TPA: hypothetical protein VHZ73_13810, partial [Vicinamibacterales bacterium]|jgi:hypothetical protein|nr:hypothetical protein [Vicinamibacterales bacterium]
VLCVGSVVRAQVAMPDPKQMAGIPRPVDDLPMGSISVRLIRGSLSNNISKFPVELHIGSRVVTVNTDENGRAQFDHLNPASTVKATATVDGEHLESQEFEVPDRGGIRLMLVATDKEKAAKDAAAAAAPAIIGTVVFGDQSRIVVEPGDETLNVWFMLMVTNRATTPVKTAGPFYFDMPTGCTGTTVIDGSSPQARADSDRIYFDGPFPPGDTPLQVACSLPVYTDTVEISEKLPATFETLAVIAKKLDDMKLSSPQILRQQDMPSPGEVAIVAEGGAIQAGQPIVLTFSGLPHHSLVPRYSALGLALVVTLVGVWVSVTPADPQARKSERQQLISRREKLFHELVRLENDRRNNRGDKSRYAGRREELLASLEQIYGALDTDEAVLQS